MRHSLQFRLLMAFVLVVAVAIGIVSLFASQSASSQFRDYVERRVEKDQGRFIGVLQGYYTENLDWSGVQPLVQRLAQVVGDRIVLADGQGTVVADSDGLLVGQPAGRFRGIPLFSRQGAQLGTVYLNPAGLDPNSESAFLSSVNRSLIIAGGAATALAFMLTWILSRRILGPVVALKAAVRAMERGDLSQRVRTDSRDEVGELAEAFNAMSSSLAHNERLRRNMVTDVAHELRTPLSNIRGYLEAMKDGVLVPNDQALGSVYEEAVRLSSLVDDLQELSLAEAGQLRMDRSPTDLSEVVDRALRAAGPQALAKGVGLSSHLNADLPSVAVDSDRIGQVLHNLIANALAHTPSGGSVAVAATPVGGAVEVVVTDTGSGIAADHLPHIFDRFYRADPSRSRSTGGSGIGLAIAKQLVQAHGGAIWAESQVGRGSSFRFTLPFS